MIPEDLRARLAQGQQPSFLCLDTCCLLDILRNPVREESRAHEHRSSLELLTRIEYGEVIYLFAQQAEIEFQEHVDAVTVEAARELSKLAETVRRVDATISVFGPAVAADLKHFADHATLSRAIVDRFRARLVPLASGDEITRRAFLRVNQARTPARRGKESMKDCVVIETYLEAVRELRLAGATGKVVFASSNINDYRERQTTKLKADLAAELTTLGIDYAPNLGAAHHLLL